MFILMSVHHPRPEHRTALIESMHRYGAAIRGCEGLVAIRTLEDAGSDRLVGLAVFASAREDAHGQDGGREHRAAQLDQDPDAQRLDGGPAGRRGLTQVT